MNILLAYYLFLVAGAVLLAAFRDSPLISTKRSQYLSFVLLPPLILVLKVLNLSFPVAVLLVLVLLLVVDRLLRTGAERPVTPHTFRLWLVVWLIEAALPLSLHLALKSRPDLESLSLLFSGLALFVGALFAFLVFAPDQRKTTN